MTLFGEGRGAVARKLAVLIWCTLMREEDYACRRLGLLPRKLRKHYLVGGHAAKVRKRCISM